MAQSPKKRDYQNIAEATERFSALHYSSVEQRRAAIQDMLNSYTPDQKRELETQKAQFYQSTNLVQEMHHS